MNGTPVIKPIETRYKGYRFRSRLEARWAVFFDTMEIPWEYEKEGFKFYVMAGTECSCAMPPFEMNVLQVVPSTICYQCYLSGRDRDYWGIDLLWSHHKAAYGTGGVKKKRTAPLL
jgi:hypothetical protein